MDRYELTKSIEAKKLSKRTGFRLSEPPTQLSYGSVLTDLVKTRDGYKFTCLLEPYEAEAWVLEPAIRKIASVGAPKAAEPDEESPAPDPPPVVAAEPAAAAATPPPSGFQWEELSRSPVRLWRSKVPGGWLLTSGSNLLLLPDPAHAWDGKTLDA